MKKITEKIACVLSAHIGIAFCIALSFGIGFAREQMRYMSSTLENIPLLPAAFTALTMTLVVWLLYGVIHTIVRKVQLERYLLLAYLPLLSIWGDVTIPVAVKYVTGGVILLLVLAIARRCNGQICPETAPKTRRHLAALVMILSIHLYANGVGSLLVLPFAPLNFPGMYSVDYPYGANLLRSFVWIKQWSLSSMDYAYWAMVPRSPTHYSSPLMQFFAVLFDAPSMDPISPAIMLTLILLILFVAGGFGFYLWLYTTMDIAWGFAVAGGILYWFAGGVSLYVALMKDFMVIPAALFAFPYALICGTQACKKASLRWAVATGAMLALPFYILVPHPEYMLLMGVAFLVLMLPGFIRARANALRIAMVMAISALVLSAKEILPLAEQMLGRGLYIIGHAEHLVMTIGRYDTIHAIMYPYIWIAGGIALCAVMIECTGKYWVKEEGWKQRRAYVWSALILVSLTIMLKPILLMAFFEMLHISLNHDYGQRRYLFTIIAEVTAGILLLDLLVKNGIKRAGMRRWIGVTAIVLACAIALYYPIPASHHLSNPQYCSYYVTQAAMHANYPLLEQDAANAKYLKQRLQTMELDLKTFGTEAEYTRFQEALRGMNITDLAAITEEASILSVSKNLETRMDDWYVNSKNACVHPVLFKRQTKEARIVNMNLASLYESLPTPFMRIASATDDPEASMDPRSSSFVQRENKRDSHLGVGPGLFVHQSNVSMDIRFMIAAPLLEALYVMPNTEFSKRGNYDSTINWGWLPEKLLDPVFRKSIDISGIDWITVRRNFYDAHRKQLHELREVPRPKIGGKERFQEITPLINERSYGMAYLAEGIRQFLPEQATQYETTIREYLKTHQDAEEYNAVKSTLEKHLASLKQKHDIVLETNAPIAEQAGPAGKASIEKIIGENTRIKIECKRPECVLVYNLAHIPNWRAYLDGVAVPIERANFAFMAVRVPQGAHELWFSYLPLTEIIGTLISLMAACGLVFGLSRTHAL